MKLLLPHLHYSVDRVNRRITTDWRGGFASVSTYYPSYGCAFAWQTPDAKTLQAARDAEGPAETETVAGITDPAIRDALACAFAEPQTGPRRNVHAIVVMHDGNIIAEQYADGFGPDTPQFWAIRSASQSSMRLSPSWSDRASWMATLRHQYRHGRIQPTPAIRSRSTS